MALELVTIPCLQDNFAFLIRDDATGTWLKLKASNLGLDTREIRGDYFRQGDIGGGLILEDRCIRVVFRRIRIMRGADQHADALVFQVCNGCKLWALLDGRLKLDGGRPSDQR